MSTSAPIHTDEFQALEQKVLRAVEVVRREREARASIEAELDGLRQQLEAERSAAAVTEAQLSHLHQERDQVRRRVEKMLQQMDELL